MSGAFATFDPPLHATDLHTHPQRSATHAHMALRRNSKNTRIHERTRA